MMKLNHDCLVRAATALLLVSVLGRAGAEESAEPAPAAPRTTGLPGEEYWSFNLDAGYGAFGFDNSLYANKKTDSPGNLSDNWQEGYIKPAISLDYPLGAGALISKLSVVGERTFSAPPPLIGGEAE